MSNQGGNKGGGRGGRGRGMGGNSTGSAGAGRGAGRGLGEPKPSAGASCIPNLEEDFPSLSVSQPPPSVWGKPSAVTQPPAPKQPVPVPQQPPATQPITITSTEFMSAEHWSNPTPQHGPEFSSIQKLTIQTVQQTAEPPKLQWATRTAAQPSQQSAIPPQQSAIPPQQSAIPPQQSAIPPQKEPQTSQQSVLTSATEEEEFKMTKINISPSKLQDNFPAKPKQRGDLGRLIRLRTNHYQVSLKPFTVHQYDIELEKKNRFAAAEKKEEEKKLIKNKDLMKAMFLKLSNEILPQGYHNKMAYNFSKNLYSLKPLPFDESQSYQVHLDNNDFTITIKKINSIIVDVSKNLDLVAIQVLDLIFTQNFNYKCINVNRSFYPDCEKVNRNVYIKGTDYFELNFGLELWKGAYTSVRPSEIGLTWNVDSANAAFLTSKDVLDLCCYHYNCDITNLKKAIEQDKDGSIIGASFLAKYQGREIKTSTGGFKKKIRGLGPDSSYKFDWKKADNTVTKITIKDYLKEHYKIVLKYPNMPCIDLGKASYLPMELCKTEIKNKKKLDEKETQDMIKISAVRAPERMNFIDNWTKRSEIQHDPVLKEYNINVNLKMLEFDGRVLEAPDIQYAPQNKTFSKQIAERGSWDHKNFKFVNSVEIKNWIVLNFAFRVKEDAANNFIQTLIKVGNIHGMKMANPKDFISDTRRNSDEQIRRIFENVATKYKPLDLILVIFAGTTNAYKIMKTCGDITYGIPSQGVEDRNVNRINEQTVSNILLKINTKLGGTNFMLSQQNMLFAKHLQDLYKGPLMIFGADVTHPSPGDNDVQESIAAVVGSLDKEGCYYGARLYAQKAPKGQAFEMIHDLDKMFISLVQEYFKKQRTFPAKIIFYRDGVSEGQFSLVLRHEMNKMRAACAHINPSYKPAITFIVVQKRHHTRLFPVNSQDSNGKAGNVPPGTVVDKVIVTPNLFDFFLCSHVGIQGTSRPCRYFVLHDDNNFSMNQVQLLSHYLCHVYSRCPRSVSYPAPAYYSHLAAFRGRDYIRRNPPPSSPNAITSYEIELHQNIKNRMFFT